MSNLKLLNNRYHITLILYVFCFLFAPPIIPKVNFILLLFVLSFILILIKYKNELLKIFKNKKIKKLFYILMTYLFVYIFSIVVNGLITGNWYIENYVINLYSFFLCFLVMPVCALYLIFRCEEKKFTIGDVINLFIKAAILQGIIVVISLLFKDIKDVLINIMYFNTGEPLLKDSWLTSRRFYGFANSLLDLFGFGTGLIAGMQLLKSKPNEHKQLIIVFLLVLIPLLNSRSGLIIFGIASILWIFDLIKHKKMNIKIFLYFILFILALIMGLYICTPETLNWIIKDFASFIGVANGTADVLFSKDFWQIPPLQNLLFGTGHNISGYSDFALSSIATSDVGYINELWKAGIIGSFLLYYFLFYILKLLNSRLKDTKYHMLPIFFGVSIAIFLIKASVFTYNPGMVVIFTLCLIAILDKLKFCKINNDEISEKLVSIIVPIYNVEKYLPRCLDSLIKQSHKNIEIILVIDGSPDDSLSICEKYQVNDKRIIIINQKNGGLSNARNTGLKNAHGEYVCFVDSDDFVDIDYVFKMLKNSLLTNSDIVCCDYVYINEVGDKWFRKKIYNQVFNQDNAIYDIFTVEQKTGIVVWNKLYKMSLFKENNLWFTEGRINEDNFIMYHLYYLANQAYLISDKLYYYLQRNTSIMGKKFNVKRFDILMALKETKKHFESNKKYKDLLICYESLIYSNLMNEMIRSSYDGKQFNEVCDHVKKSYRKYLRNPFIKIRNKIIFTLFMLNKKLYIKLLSIKDNRENG